MNLSCEGLQELNVIRVNVCSIILEDLYTFLGRGEISYFGVESSVLGVNFQLKLF